MKYLVAVSGGIDSVVLLDMLVAEGKHELTVGHFDHGIRDDSAADARFVELLAARYNLPYAGRREELGKDASEEVARSRRYRFLGEEALIREAKIVTAHHQDDVIETIAINLQRGTGWRGLAVLGGKHIVRPLLGLSKEDIREYALEHRLEWVEDSTNASGAYLRNRLRRQLHKMLGADVRQQVITLWKKQLVIRQDIEEEGSSFIDTGPLSRYFFTQINEKVATELLRAYFESCFGWSPTRPQLERTLLVIKTARAGTLFPFGGAQLLIEKKFFRLSVKTP
jgi:tRNA(Ile)-lysidine synthetase-like protein